MEYMPQCHIDIVYSIELNFEQLAAQRLIVGCGFGHTYGYDSDGIADSHRESSIHILTSSLSVSCCQCHPVDYYYYVSDEAYTSASIKPRATHISLQNSSDTQIVHCPAYNVEFMYSHTFVCTMYSRVSSRHTASVPQSYIRYTLLNIYYLIRFWQEQCG